MTHMVGCDFVRGPLYCSLRGSVRAH